MRNKRFGQTKKIKAFICILIPLLFLMEAKNNAYAETEYILEEEPVPSVNDSSICTIPYDDVIPGQYDSRTLGIVPAVRNQSIYNLCWTFATMAGTEISAIKNGIANRDEIDLSERHNAYYSYHLQNDPLGGIEGDGTIVTSQYNQTLGNIDIASLTLINWKGAVKEELAPLVFEEENLGDDLDLAFYQDRYHVQNVRGFSTATDADLMKKAIMEYGSVMISFNSSLSYYNAQNAAQYCPHKTGTTHAVTVVGWDDAYSKDNFTDKPVADGAWIVRNSMGDNFGKDGYFYLSYEDKSMGPNAYAIAVEKSDNYDNNYQYDGTSFSTTKNMSGDSVTIANVFTAAANKSGMEQLEAVSFKTAMANHNYEIMIYKNLADLSNPASGTPALTSAIEGTVSASGYYTIPLGCSIDLQEGDTFSVVVTFQKDSEEMKVLVDGQRQVSATIKTVAAAKPGQSFVCSDGVWSDWGAENNSNFRIKAFTVNKEKQKDFPFTDIEVKEGDWKYESADFVYKNNIMRGTDTNIFSPDTNMTRAMVAVVLYSLDGKPLVEDVNSFTDVQNPGAWYYPAISWAYKNGIVAGYSDGRFGINDSVTREQLIQMLYKYASYKGQKLDNSVKLDMFSDANQVDDWALAAMEWAVGNKIINGRKTDSDVLLCPRNATTRIECAAILRSFKGKANYEKK